MGQAPPARTRFAFLVHPRTDVAADLATVHPLLGAIPGSWCEAGLRRLPLKPWVQATIEAADRPGSLLGEVIVLPLTPRQLLGEDRAFVKRRIDEGVDLAVRRGARLIGLGALTAPATGGGVRLKGRRDVGVTNGNAFTAAATVRTIEAVADGRRPVIALAGATGSVGAAVARLLAAGGTAGELLLVARTPTALAALARELGPGVRTSVDLTDCRRADIVVLMTSATGDVLGPQHLKPGAVVIDDTQPRNTSPGLLALRPDVTVLDGGLVATPGLLRRGRSIGIDAGVSFACLAETALLALDGQRGHGTLGKPTLAQVERLAELAGRYAHLGFHPAAPTSFGRPVELPGWSGALAPRGDGVAA